MKIRFDNVDFVNYRGIQELMLPTGWEDVYNKLIQDNSILNIASGYIFSDNALHVAYRWSFLKKHNFQRQSFISNIVDRFLSGPNRINQNLRFTGFFKIVNYDNHKHSTQSGYYLIPNNQCYMSQLLSHDGEIMSSERIRIPNYYEFGLQQNQIWADGRNRAAIPFDSNCDFSSDDEFIKEKLYFELSEVISACRAHFEHEFDIESTAPDLLYENGVQVVIPKKLENNERNKTQTRDQIMESKDRIIAACFWVLKNDQRPNFKFNTDICNHLETHLKDIPALNYQYMKGFIGTATDELKEREVAQGYKETYLDRMKKRV